jgi:hypothetical protein
MFVHRVILFLLFVFSIAQINAQQSLRGQLKEMKSLDTSTTQNLLEFWDSHKNNSGLTDELIANTDAQMNHIRHQYGNSIMNSDNGFRDVFDILKNIYQYSAQEKTEKIQYKFGQCGSLDEALSIVEKASERYGLDLAVYAAGYLSDYVESNDDIEEIVDRLRDINANIFNDIIDQINGGGASGEEFDDEGEEFDD